MQTQLFEIRELLSVWYLVALENKIFVTALIVAIWIIFSILHSIRTYFLEKKLRYFERNNFELRKELITTEYTIKENKLALANAEQQMEEEQQTSVEYNKKTVARQRQVVEKIREVARNFDLNEQLVGSSDSISNEIIWQQQDNMISQLIEKLVVEKNVTSALQVTHNREDSAVKTVKEALEGLTKQVSKLESSALEKSDQKKVSKNAFQEQLIGALAKNQTEVIELISKLTLSGGVNNSVQKVKLESIATDVVNSLDPKALGIVEEKTIKSEIVQITEVKPAPVMESVAIKINIPVVPTVDKKVVENTDSRSVSAAPALEVVDVAQTAPEVEKEKVVKKQTKKEKSKNIFGFTKSLFSTKGMKKMPKQVVSFVEEKQVSTEAVITDDLVESAEFGQAKKRNDSVKLEKSDYSSGINLDLKGKLKRLLARNKK
jgi:hypothetical protein